MAKTKNNKGNDDFVLALGLALASVLGLVLGLALASVLGLVLGLALASVLGFGLVLALGLVLGLVFLDEKYTWLIVTFYLIGVAIGAYIGYQQTQINNQSSTTTTPTTTILPFNLTCQQIQAMVNGNFSNSIAQTYLALYRAKGC